MTATTPRIAARLTKRSKTIIIVTAAVVAAALIVAAVFVLTGVLPGARSASTYPPCDQLPSKSEAQDALASHTALANDLASQGRDVQIEVATPCASDPSAALIEVSYTESTSHDAIKAVLTEADGFGVPAHVTKR